MTTAAPTISARIHSLNRPNMVSIGTIVWLSSELMFFAGLFAMYFTVRAQNRRARGRRAPTELNIPYALVFTIVLVASSFTCQFGVFAAERGDVFGLRRWYLLTLVMGTFFVLGQANEYRTPGHGARDDARPPAPTARSSTWPPASTGCTSSGGLLAFIFLLIRTKLSKFTPAQATAAIVVSYYWHFVDVVWIALFSVIYFIR